MSGPARTRTNPGGGSGNAATLLPPVSYVAGRYGTGLSFVRADGGCAAAPPASTGAAVVRGPAVRTIAGVPTRAAVRLRRNVQPTPRRTGPPRSDSRWLPPGPIASPGKASLEATIDLMRHDIRIEGKDAAHAGGRSLVAFQISFRGRDPERVAQATNALASFYVDRSRAQRAQQARNALRTGTTIPFDPSIKIEVLNPDDAAVNSDDTNDASIVIKLTYGTTSFLLTGDAEMPANKAILDHGFDVRSTVLKLGHHGSRTSTNEDWLQHVQPQLGIISAGRDNSFGHPHPEVIAALENLKIPYIRTDEHGTITVTSDGSAIHVTSDR